MRSNVPALTFALSLVALAGCTKPEPPTLVPERVRITSISMTKIDLDVTLTATNPNAIDLVTHDITAHVIVGGTVDVGTVTIPVSTTFPAGKATKLEAPLSVQVKDVAPLARLAMGSDKVPYTVDGTVGFGGDLLHVEVPFHIADTIPRDQIVQATLGAIPGLGGRR